MLLLYDGHDGGRGIAVQENDDYPVVFVAKITRKGDQLSLQVE